MRDYVAISYRDKPMTHYPLELVSYLVERYDIKGRLLDLGCGRAEHVNAFISLGFTTYGIDSSFYSKEPNITHADFSSKIPFDNNLFDMVFSKSVIEHLYSPELAIGEVYRILKPGGLFIVMTPDFRKSRWRFWGDYTHRTPFTKSSLEEILMVGGFWDIQIERFRQSPPLWKHPGLTPIFCVLSRLPWIKNNNIKYSRADMLLGTGRKEQ